MFGLVPFLFWVVNVSTSEVSPDNLALKKLLLETEQKDLNMSDSAKVNENRERKPLNRG